MNYYDGDTIHHRHRLLYLGVFGRKIMIRTKCKSCGKVIWSEQGTGL